MKRKCRLAGLALPQSRCPPQANTRPLHSPAPTLQPGSITSGTPHPAPRLRRRATSPHLQTREPRRQSAPNPTDHPSVSMTSATPSARTSAHWGHSRRRPARQKSLHPRQPRARSPNSQDPVLANARSSPTTASGLRRRRRRPGSPSASSASSTSWTRSPSTWSPALWTEPNLAGARWPPAKTRSSMSCPAHPQTFLPRLALGETAGEPDIPPRARAGRRRTGRGDCDLRQGLPGLRPSDRSLHARGRMGAPLPASRTPCASRSKPICRPGMNQLRRRCSARGLAHPILNLILPRTRRFLRVPHPFARNPRPCETTRYHDRNDWAKGGIFSHPSGVMALGPIQSGRRIEVYTHRRGTGAALPIAHGCAFGAVPPLVGVRLRRCLPSVQPKPNPQAMWKWVGRTVLSLPRRIRRGTQPSRSPVSVFR